MSTTIDQRVVEMRFDNKHFEQNVQNTMSTLDKLKQKLNLTGASKGLDSINNAAKSNNIGMLGAAAEQVSVKFSAMQIAGITAITRLTNKAIDAGEKIINALTIDPIKTGFQEYETQINAVQTILANTSHAGTNIDDVNKALEELNKYADMTIYNFTEMTRNIGTFTAAGVNLDTSVSAIKGIANLAAVSGSTSQQASTAMYQLSQALAAGRVSLQDWNSVVNAGMGGKVFQDALIRTSEVMKTGAKEAIGKNGSFRESLSKGKWLTTDVLTETLNQFTMAAKEGSLEWENYKKSLKEKGYTEAQAIEILKMANTATDAATKVKTFTQLWDVLKESAQSGWSQTWKLVVGDFEEAKALLTPVSDFLTGIINKMSDFRNKIVAAAMKSPFAEIVDKIKSISKVTEKVVDVTKDYEKVVNEVIRGKWGHTEKRWNALAEAGYNWAKVQNMVNEKLGNSKRHNEKLAEAQIKSNKAQQEGITITENTIKSLAKMNDMELRNLGFAPEDVETLRELDSALQRTGYTMKEVLDNPDILGGRALLIDTFKNFGKVMVDLGKAIKVAWNAIINDGASSDQVIHKRAMSIYNLIASLRGFSARLAESMGSINDTNSTLGKLIRTFKGVFVIVDTVATIFGGAFSIAFKVFLRVLKALDLNLLDVAANLGDALVGFRNMYRGVIESSGVIDVLVSAVLNVIDVLKYLFTLLYSSGIFKLFIQQIKDSAKAIGDWFKGFKDADNIVKYLTDGFLKALKGIVDNFDEFADLISKNISKIPNEIIAGLTGGLWSGATGVIKTVARLAIAIIETACNILGIHSPSVEFFNIGKNVMLGLWEGIESFAGQVWNSIKNVGTKAIEIFKELDLGQIFAGLISVGFLSVANKIAKGFVALTAPAQGLGDMLSAVGNMIEDSTKNFNKVLKSFSKVLNSFAMGIKAKALKDVAIAIAILVGAFAILTLLDPKKMLVALGVLTVLAAGLTALFVAIDKVCGKGQSVGDNLKNALNLTSISAFMIAMSVSLLIMVGVLKLLETVDINKAPVVLGGLLVILGSFAAIFFAFGKLVKGKSAQNFGKVGGMMLKMSIALLLMVGVVKLISMLSLTDMGKGLIFVAGFTAFVWALSKVTENAGRKIDKLGGMMLKMSIALLLMVGVVKAINLLSMNEMGKGLIFIAGFTAFVWALVSVTKQNKDTEIAKISGLLLSISVSMLLMAGIVKLIAGMTWGELAKGAIGIVFFSLIIKSLITSVKSVGNAAPKIAGTLLAIAGAIAILGLVSLLLGFVGVKALAKGIIAVGLLTLMMSMLVKSTKDAKDVGKTAINMAIAIGIMAAAIVALSLIKDTSAIAVAVAAIGSLMIAFSLMIKATQNASKCVGNLVVMTVAVGLLAGIVYLLSKGVKDGDNALKAIGAMSLLITSMAYALTLVNKVGGSVKNSIQGMILLTAMAIPLAVFAATIKYLPSVAGKEKEIAALTLVISAMSGVLTAVTYAGKFGWKSMATGVVGLTAMVIPLMAFALAISAIPPIGDKTKELLTISAVMAAMTLLLIPLTSMSTVIGAMGMKGAGGLAAVLIALAAMAGELVLFGLAINAIPQISDKTASLAVLTAAMAAMTLLLIPLTAIGLVLGASGLIGAAGLLGALVALAAMAGELVIFGYAISVIPDVTSAIPSLEAVVGAMIAMTAVLIAVSKIAPLAMAAVGVIGALEIVTLIFMGIAAVIGLIADKSKNFETFVGKGSEILINVAKSIGKFVAALITGFGEGIGDGLANIGKSLSDFMTNAEVFIDGASQIDESVLSGVTSLAKAILLITAADILNGLAFFSDNSIGTFGAQLPQLGEDLSAFAEKLGTFDEATVTTVQCAGDAIVALATAAGSIDGQADWAKKLFGDNSLATFGAQLPALGSNLSSFVTSLGTFDDNTVKTVNCAGEAIKALSSAASEIPNDGGLWGKIFGENSLATFGGYLPGLGTNLKSFITNLGAFDDATLTTVDCAGEAIVSLADAASKIPNDGGLWGKIFGDNSLATFGGYLPGLGTNLNSFITNLGTFSDESVATVDCAGRAITAMASAASNIDGQSDWAKKLFGDNSLASFGKDMEKLGTNLAKFVSNLGTFTATQVTTTNCAVSAIKALANLADADLKTAKKHMDGFGDELPGLATDMADFCENLPSKDNITTATTNIKNLIAILGDMGKANTKEAIEFANGLKKIGEKAIKKFVDAFGSEETNLGVTKAATTMMDKLIDGMESKEKTLKTAFGKVASNGVSAIKEYEDDFESAGKALCEGLRDGINNNKSKAVKAAESMAAAVKNAAKSALQINSPSKVFVAIGSGVIEGFVKGIDDNLGYTKTAVVDMADTAKNGFGKAISSMTGLLDGSIEMQPTIRPVLDLSNVKTGAASIGGLLGNQSVGVSSNVNAITSMMNKRNQNGANSDVVSAINKLRGDLGKTGNTTYNVNGITYDDGSNISDAINTLIRATIIEGRA